MATPSNANRWFVDPWRLIRLWLIGLVAAIVCALVVLAIVWRGQPPPAEAALAQIRRAADRGDWQLASVLAERYVRHRSRDPEARLLAARVAAGAKDFSTCIAHLAEIDRRTPQGPEARLREGQAWLELGWAVRAERCWQDCLSIAPDYVPVRWHLVELYSIEGRRTEAARLLSQLYEREPNKQSVLTMLMRLTVAGDEPFPDSALLERFVETDPADYHSRLSLARFCLRSGKTDLAIGLLQECLKLKPLEVEARSELAACLVVHCAADPATAHRLLESLPPPESVDSVNVCRALGLLYSTSQDWTRAAQYYQRGVALEPYCASFQHQLGLALSHLDRPEERRAALERFQAIREHRQWIEDACYKLADPTEASADFYCQIGEHCEALGLLQLARAWYKEALRLEPLHTSSNLAFMRVLRILKCPAETGAQSSASRTELTGAVSPD